MNLIAGGKLVEQLAVCCTGLFGPTGHVGLVVKVETDLLSKKAGEQRDTKRQNMTDLANTGDTQYPCTIPSWFGLR